MKIAVIGAGYVGLTTAACIASAGQAIVTCIETDMVRLELLQSGNCPIDEPELGDIIIKSIKSKTLIFTKSSQEAIVDADMVFIAVGTPSAQDGSADLSAFQSALEKTGQYLKQGAIVIIKSTIPPMGTKLAKDILAEKCHSRGVAFGLAYCPEFLREGTAVKDFLSPDRNIIGTDDRKAARKISELYKAFQVGAIPTLFVSPVEAELIKYASNSFLALKVAFINDLARLCGSIGGDINAVTNGIGMDRRIGHSHLHPGPGYGGACLPKDIKGLAFFARSQKVPQTILEQTIISNTEHQRWLASVISERIGQSAIVAIWGLTFKAGTNDLRDSPSISLIRKLSKLGEYKFKLYDPTVQSDQITQLDGTQYKCFSTAMEAIYDAHALIVAVSWPEFYNYSLPKIIERSKLKHIFDLCLLWANDSNVQNDIYWALGKGEINAG